MLHGVEMNTGRPINSLGRKGVDGVDRFLAESSRSTEPTKVESVDRVGRFSVELSRFVRLDRFQGLLYTYCTASPCVNESCDLQQINLRCCFSLLFWGYISAVDCR